MSEKTEDLKGLGAFIRSQRRLAELSQRELAKLAKLSDPYVSQLERGLHEPSVRVVKALSAALNLPAEVLMKQAGWLGLDVAEDPETEAAIRKDSNLTSSQKSAMLEIYKGFTTSNETK